MGLRDEPLGELGPGDPVGETRVVVDPVTDPGLAPEGAGVDDDGVDALASGVDGSRQPRWSAADDDEVIGGPIGLDSEADASSQGLVARVHLVGPVSEDDGGDDLPPDLQFL